MTHQDFIDKRKADLASALLANIKPTSRNRGTTAAEVAASFNMEHDDDSETIETVPNPNANGRKWLKVTATNILPAHLAGE